MGATTSIVPESQRLAMQEIMTSKWLLHTEDEAKLVTKNTQPLSEDDFVKAINYPTFIPTNSAKFIAGNGEFYTLDQPYSKTIQYTVLTHTDLGISILDCENLLEAQLRFLSRIMYLKRTENRKFYIPDLTYWLYLSNPKSFANISKKLKDPTKVFLVAGVAFRRLNGHACVPVVYPNPSSFIACARHLGLSVESSDTLFVLEILNPV